MYQIKKINNQSSLKIFIHLSRILIRDDSEFEDVHNY